MQNRTGSWDFTKGAQNSSIAEGAEPASQKTSHHNQSNTSARSRFPRSRFPTAKRASDLSKLQASGNASAGSSGTGHRHFGVLGEAKLRYIRPRGQQHPDFMLVSRFLVVLSDPLANLACGHSNNGIVGCVITGIFAENLDAQGAFLKIVRPSRQGLGYYEFQEDGKRLLLWKCGFRRRRSSCCKTAALSSSLDGVQLSICSDNIRSRSLDPSHLE